jgi:hypothetical protein
MTITGRYILDQTEDHSLLPGEEIQALNESPKEELLRQLESVIEKVQQVADSFNDLLTENRKLKRALVRVTFFLSHEESQESPGKDRAELLTLIRNLGNGDSHDEKV